jgi:aspartate racemase
MAMQTIGMFAGTSWASSVEYYRIINQTVQKMLGGNNSAKMVIHSVNFEELIETRDTGGWEAVGDEVVQIAKDLKAAGADFFMLAVNTIHIVADRIEPEAGIPILHIADTTAAAIKAAGLKKVGLMGTRYTMLEDFYRVRLKEMHGIDVIVPGAEDVDKLHDIIFDELVIEKFLEPSRLECLRMAEDLASAGAEGVILGCTELPLIMKPEDMSVPSFDTMTLHAVAAAERAVEGS